MTADDALGPLDEVSRGVGSDTELPQPRLEQTEAVLDEVVDLILQLLDPLVFGI